MSQPFIGTIAIFAFNFAPRDWALCNGQIMPIAQNQALFALIGTTYGGNGTTTFGLPNLQGRVPMSMGTGTGLTTRVIGEFSGAENVQLQITQLPPHTHAITLNNLAATANAKNAAGNSQTPLGNVPAIEAAGVTATYSNAAPDATMGAGAISVTGTATAALTGNGFPVSILPPFLVLNYCIALVGLFPSRN
jgi:microcystin-dependent protein